MIIPIGRWVLLEACRQLSEWRSIASVPLSISVNLSGKQFQPGLVEEVRQILKQTKLDPHTLMLEITESMIMENPEATIEMLLQLKAIDVEIHIDDFGTGYSSLSYLQRFPIDTLKIDRSFVSRIGVGEKNLEIVRAIIGLAHSLGMTVIAEGVQTAEELAHLCALGSEWAQGFYFSRPVDAITAQKLLESSQTWQVYESGRPNDGPSDKSWEVT